MRLGLVTSAITCFMASIASARTWNSQTTAYGIMAIGCSGIRRLRARRRSRRALAGRRLVRSGKLPWLVDRRIRAEQRAVGMRSGDQAHGDASLLRLVEAELQRVHLALAGCLDDFSIHHG